MNHNEKPSSYFPFVPHTPACFVVHAIKNKEGRARDECARLYLTVAGVDGSSWEHTENQSGPNAGTMHATKTRTYDKREPSP